jgi:3-dehydroquinate synthase
MLLLLGRIRPVADDNPGLPTITKVKVAAASNAYEVLIGRQLLERAGELMAPVLGRSHVFVVADQTAWGLHGQRFLSGLVAAGISHSLIVVAPGEASKSFGTLESVTSGLLAAGISRNDHVVAFGGGVIGDLAGFAAGIVMRGVRFIQVPTTLLAQVDSSVGGKTGINTPEGKNMVGLFWQPDLVLADSDCLTTLDPRDLRSGWAEVIKYGLIDDRPFFDWCAANACAVLALDQSALIHAVTVSVQAKARVVGADERESGVRALLNLGHTFAHALESAAGYDETLLRHGEAVGCGMALAAAYSVELGLMDAPEAEAVRACFAASGLADSLAALPHGLIRKLDPTTLLATMLGDKKNESGALTLILMRSVGQSFIEKAASQAHLGVWLGHKVSEARARLA